MNIDKRIKYLQTQVSPYATQPLKTHQVRSNSVSPHAILTRICQPVYMYSIVPVIVLILTLWCRPKYAMKTVEKDGKKLSTLSYGNLFISVSIISILLVIGMYGYWYNK